MLQTAEKVDDDDDDHDDDDLYTALPKQKSSLSVSLYDKEPMGA